MKRIVIACAIIVASTVAAAAQATSTTPTKTGYQIPGCAFYVIEVRGGKMTKICHYEDTKDAKLFWERNNRIGGGTSGGQ